MGVITKGDVKRLKEHEDKVKHPEKYGIDGKKRTWKQRH